MYSVRRSTTAASLAQQIDFINPVSSWNACFATTIRINRLLCSSNNTHGHQQWLFLRRILNHFVRCMQWTEGGTVTNQSRTESQPLFNQYTRTHIHCVERSVSARTHNMCMLCTAMFAGFINVYTVDFGWCFAYFVRLLARSLSHSLAHRTAELMNKKRTRRKTSRIPEISKNKPMPVAHTRYTFPAHHTRPAFSICHSHSLSHSLTHIHTFSWAPSFDETKREHNQALLVSPSNIGAQTYLD